MRCRKPRLIMRKLLSPNVEHRYWPRPTFRSNPPALNFFVFSQTSLGLRLNSFMKSLKLIARRRCSMRCFIINNRVSFDSAAKIFDSWWKSSSKVSSSSSRALGDQSVDESGRSKMISLSRTIWSRRVIRLPHYRQVITIW